MNFLERLGLKKKKEEEVETAVAVAPQSKPSAISRIGNIMNNLNKPLGGGMGFNATPQRTPRERQLGIPEYVAPRERARDFSVTPKPIPQAKKVITNWRPTPGKVSRKGEEVKW